MILGFTGYMGSGKSTACQYILDSYPGWVWINFKEGLINEIKQNFPDLLREIESQRTNDQHMFDIDSLFKDKPPLARALLQNYGTEVRRRDNPNYWVEIWSRKVSEAIENGLNVVTDDVRFLNEAAAVKSVGGEIIRIIRSDISTGGTHMSEVEMNKIVPDIEITCGQGEHQVLYAAINSYIKTHGKD